MEVFLGSLALGAAGAAAEGLYRRFKRRRIGTTGVAALSGEAVQRLGAVEDGASTDGGASATGSDHPPGKPPDAPVTPAAAATGAKPRGPAGAVLRADGGDRQRERSLLVVDLTQSDSRPRGACHTAANPATSPDTAAAQQASGRRKRKHSARDGTASQESEHSSGAHGTGCGVAHGGQRQGTCWAQTSQQVVSAAGTAHGDGREAKQRLSRELKHLQPFGWDKYLEDQPLGPEMDSVLHHIQEAVQEAEEEVGGQQADAEETAAEERAHSGTGGGGAARRHRGRAKRWDSDEEC